MYNASVEIELRVMFFFFLWFLNYNYSAGVPSTSGRVRNRAIFITRVVLSINTFFII